MMMRTGKPVHLDDIEPITWGGEEAARFLLRGEDTGGLYSFYEVSVPPGGSSLFHIHEDMDEAFYVIEGRFEIKLGGVVHEAPAGTLIYGPRGVGHSFLNTWRRPSKMLCTTTPGGIENFFGELSELMRQGPFPEWERMRELAARHHIIACRPPGRSPEGPTEDMSSHSNQE